MPRDDRAGGPPGEASDAASRAAAVGLCSTCAHARTIESRRGSRFWMCGLAERDPAFARYPRLPVIACPGHRPGGANRG